MRHGLGFHWPQVFPQTHFLRENVKCGTDLINPSYGIFSLELWISEVSAPELEHSWRVKICLFFLNQSVKEVQLRFCRAQLISLVESVRVSMCKPTEPAYPHLFGPPLRFKVDAANLRIMCLICPVHWAQLRSN